VKIDGNTLTDEIPGVATLTVTATSEGNRCRLTGGMKLALTPDVELNDVFDGPCGPEALKAGVLKITETFQLMFQRQGAPGPSYPQVLRFLENTHRAIR
jgi:hypothetical protein